jgi:hypothetical protein
MALMDAADARAGAAETRTQSEFDKLHATDELAGPTLSGEPLESRSLWEQLQMAPIEQAEATQRWRESEAERDDYWREQGMDWDKEKFGLGLSHEERMEAMRRSLTDTTDPYKRYAGFMGSTEIASERFNEGLNTLLTGQFMGDETRETVMAQMTSDVMSMINASLNGEELRGLVDTLDNAETQGDARKIVELFKERMPMLDIADKDIADKLLLLSQHALPVDPVDEEIDLGGGEQSPASSLIDLLAPLGREIAYGQHGIVATSYPFQKAFRTPTSLDEWLENLERQRRGLGTGP